MNKKILTNNNTLYKYSYELKSEYDDLNFEKLNKIFIEYIDKSYDLFTKNLEKEKIKINENKILLNSFTPEKLSRKSPITLIDAPWGSGKTYFIENFSMKFIEGKIKSSFFKKVIIIDTWKFSNSSDIPNEIMSEIFYKLIKISDTKELKNKSIKDNLKKVASRMFDTTLRSWANNGLFLDIKEISQEKSKEELIESASEYLEPTIIFLDNIERIGNDSWEIIKAIMKLSQIKSFFIILPMNMNQLKNFDSNLLNNSNENYIQKIIDVPYFRFRQEYHGMLSKKNFNQEEIEIFNNLLKSNIDGFNLSIRQAEDLLEKTDFNKTQNIFEKINFFYKNIWGPAEEIVDVIINLIKKMNFFEFISKQKNIFDELKEKLNENSIFKKNEKINKTFYKYLFLISYEYEGELKYIKQFIKELLEENIRKIDNNKSLLVDFDKKINKWKNDLKKYESKIDELKNFNDEEIGKIENSDEEVDNEKISNNLIKINVNKDLSKKTSTYILNKEKEIPNLEKEIDKLISSKNYLEDIIINIDAFLKYENIKFENENFVFLSKKIMEFDKENNFIFFDLLENNKLKDYYQELVKKVLD